MGQKNQSSTPLFYKLQFS